MWKLFAAALLKTAIPPPEGDVDQRRPSDEQWQHQEPVPAPSPTDLIGDDRATIYGALLWMADKLNSEDGARARELWAEKGKAAFAEGQPLT